LSTCSGPKNLSTPAILIIGGVAPAADIDPPRRQRGAGVGGNLGATVDTSPGGLTKT
jgi:hypothetical protein